MLVAKEAMRQRGRGRAPGGLAWIFPCQAEYTLNEPDRPDAAFGERGPRPLMQRQTDALAASQQLREERLLTGRQRRGPRARHRRVVARWHARVHHHQLVAAIDTHKMVVPLHTYEIAEQPRGHGIVAAVNFDVSVGMHRARA